MKRKIQFYLTLLVIFSAVLLAFSFCIYVIKDIPSVKVLKHLENRPVSSIYGANDQLVYLLVPDNRVFVSYNRIPKHVKDAFLAAEDAEFFKHGAVDPEGILRALWKNIISGRVVQGGSTITQQVIKSLILGPERSMLRKAREAILAYKLEGYLSKREILNLYLNNVYMGHGVYGVEAASQVYFGKHIWNVTRAEGALLAGIVQAPSRNTPKRHPGNARIRQEYVIEQMADKGFIDEKRKNEILKEKINIREDNGVFTDSYFKDYVLKYIEKKYGKGVLSTRKLSIYATVDPQFQKLAEEAVKRGLSVYEQRKGAYSVLYNLERKKWDRFIKAQERDLKQSPLITGKTYSILISERFNDGYGVLVGKEKGILKIDTFPYTPGDVIKAVYEGIDAGKTRSFQPVKSLNVEGALLCMDVQSGYIYAMVGGRDFEQSPYNRAVTAKVQSGSAFKPFIYLAALKKGYTPDSMIPDEPKAYPAGGGRTWTPRNYDGVYTGQVSMRDAVAYSKNAATVGLLEEVGVSAVRQSMAELGINADLPQELSIALGTSNLTLLDLVKGFSAFANGGYRIQPIFVRKVVDRNGTVLEENPVQKERAIPEDIAQMMNMLLKGPTRYGTAKGVSRLGYPLAGKTGTTSNYYDALFVGYSPHIATGVWVGFDSRASLGHGESGARVCLPIWMSFMSSALRRYPPDDFGPSAPAEPEFRLDFWNWFRSEPKSEPRPEPKSDRQPEPRQEPRPEPWPRIY
ncbi:MAG: Penicillin-binding protein 1A [Syntrophorhabdus sp. PtaU1.Bin153]|nr:MAG: Penicillin-binding protein 1A [Syntrophorhabdus sp. PtaU1.Bin153]